jgi:hypothetical protein
MDSNVNTRPYFGLVLTLCAVVLTACAGQTGGAQSYLSASVPTDSAPSVQVDAVARCKQFTKAFDELVACERSNGTLDSFSSRSVAWRVRYFVRNSEMPCDEAPTVQEAYVYHAVVNDLNADQDLDAEQRTAIRTAMFEGKVPCNT